jgi:hypothetical protein
MPGRSEEREDDMPQYLCVDGPLDGELLGSADAHEPGEVLEIEVVDIAQTHAPRFSYAVETPAAFRKPGRLRHLPLAG